MQTNKETFSFKTSITTSTTSGRTIWFHKMTMHSDKGFSPSPSANTRFHWLNSWVAVEANPPPPFPHCNCSWSKNAWRLDRGRDNDCMHRVFQSLSFCLLISFVITGFKSHFSNKSLAASLSIPWFLGSRQGKCFYRWHSGCNLFYLKKEKMIEIIHLPFVYNNQSATQSKNDLGQIQATFENNWNGMSLFLCKMAVTLSACCLPKGNLAEILHIV